jgi:carboxymethylenebutenolidase
MQQMTTIDYYFAAQSPWTYLGHARFAELVMQAGCAVRVRPADFGKVFAATGGLPLGKRAPQRQAYRLVELRRFADFLGLPMHVQPRYFPVAGDDASRLIIAVDMADGAPAALRLSGAVLTAVWAEQRDIADAGVLAELLSENDLPAERLAQSREEPAQQMYAQHTQSAIDAGVFGAPSYCVDGEIFWGQDRLDFLQRRLGRD